MSLSKFHSNLRCPNDAAAIIAACFVFMAFFANGPYLAAAAPAVKSTAPAPTIAAIQAADEAAWHKLHQATARTEKKNPGKAALVYRQYLRDYPDMQPAVAVEVLVAVVDIYEDRLHDDATANSIRNWANAKYADAPGLDRLKAFPSAAAKAWQRLHEDSAPQEAAMPQQMALRYWRFLKANPNLEPKLAAEAAKALVGLYQGPLKDAAGAEKVRRWFQHKYAAYPQASLLLTRTAAEESHAVAVPDAVDAGDAFYTPKAAQMMKAVLGDKRVFSSSHAAALRLALENDLIEANLKALPARAALTTVAAPALKSPAQLWGLAPAQLVAVPPPSQTWTPAMFGDQLKVIGSGLDSGRFMGEKVTPQQVALAHKQEAARAQANALVQVRLTAQLKALYSQEHKRFWTAEPVSTESTPIERLAPLSPRDRRAPLYRAAAKTAEQFVAMQTRAGRADQRTPEMLYLAAMSETSLQNHKAALASIEELLREYPQYRFASRGEAAKQAQAVRDGMIHLRLYHQASMLAPASAGKTKSESAVASADRPGLTLASLPRPKAAPAPNSFAIELLRTEPALQLLHEIAGQAAGVLQVEASNPESPAMRAPTPDELRAAALPDAKLLAIRLHDALLPEAIEQSGGKAARDYLRMLLGSDKPFAGLPRPNLWISIE